MNHNVPDENERCFAHETLAPHKIWFCLKILINNKCNCFDYDLFAHWVSPINRNLNLNDTPKKKRTVKSVKFIQVKNGIIINFCSDDQLGLKSFALATATFIRYNRWLSNYSNRFDRYALCNRYLNGIQCSV